MLRKSERRPENRIHEPAKAILGGNSSRAKLFFIKNLRDHVSSIIIDNIIMETNFNIENRTTETNNEVNNYTEITTNADENCSAASNNNICDNHIDNSNNRDILHETHIKYLMTLRT